MAAQQTVIVRILETSALQSVNDHQANFAMSRENQDILRSVLQVLG